MFVAPVVACEISAPPTTPRGTSRSWPACLTTFMAGSLVRRGPRRSHFERVIQPLRARAADPVVDRLRARVVLRRLPHEPARPLRRAALPARLDQRLRQPAAARLGRDEQ